ncbi:Putative serine protease HhoA precursor [Gemmata sp. SH-PL17]|uniref:S1 family peptidase n=1 Tax=Gemmata sp. SH-PL17 TaxID=1630693 RepID=UPI0004BAE0B6|nr:serine protease [Gemmata sp. SH-PL17]AMV25853.1 Putative serine protease HhoA precursor [Gemmata sp. SH-PL17]
MLLALTFVLGTASVNDPLASCAWVRAENDGAGSGFVVDVQKRLLVTCRHVVADRKKVDVFLPWYRDGELVTDRREYLRNRPKLRESGLFVSGMVLKTSDEFDLALVELESLPKGAKAVVFSARVPQTGDWLRVIGHRIDIDTIWNTTVGPLRTSGKLSDGYFWRGKKLALGASALVAQFSTDEGDSGGPVFNARGEVVGMDCALRRACPLAAIVISASDIRTFLNAPPKQVRDAEPVVIAEALTRATVWIRPTATDVHMAGALIEKDLVLTCARGLTVMDRVGVALPLRDGDRWVSERGAYRDPLALHLRAAYRSGVVLARDATRDLALIRLDSGSDHMKPLSLAARVPKPGDALHAMSHPGGLEFAWVYANGSVRQRGRVTLDVGEKAPAVNVLVGQLPAQAGSPGGPLVNVRGELVGALASREGAQQVGYAATTDEIRAFLDVALRDRPARTLTGLLACIESIPAHQARLLARGFGLRAEHHRSAGRFAEAKRDCDHAVMLDASCVEARLCRARMFEPEAALAELDTAVEKGPFHRDVLVRRAVLAIGTKDFRKARGDLERVLDVYPADTDAREGLARAFLGLGDDTKAATAFSDSVRTDSGRIKSVAKLVANHADVLEQKFPNSPGTASEWLTKALNTIEKGARDLKTRRMIADLLKSATSAQNDRERLKLLRAGIAELEAIGGVEPIPK